MNFHNNEWFQQQVSNHYTEALEHFQESRIVGIFYQGSGNYGLDTCFSDVDTKLIVTPTFEEIAFNKKPHSFTHMRVNQEHIDFKDIRLMIQTFKKQNLNFLEILFTDYYILNPLYEQQWMQLVEEREKIAYYNPYSAVKSMKGIAMEKFHAMEHPYPSKIEIFQKYSYDPKQLHHLLRVEEYLQRYIQGEPYSKCLRSLQPDYLIAVKNGLYSLEEARKESQKSISQITSLANAFCTDLVNYRCCRVDKILDSVQLEIMKISLNQELSINV